MISNYLLYSSVAIFTSIDDLILCLSQVEFFHQSIALNKNKQMINDSDSLSRIDDLILNFSQVEYFHQSIALNKDIKYNRLIVVDYLELL